MSTALHTMAETAAEGAHEAGNRTQEDADE